MKHFRWIPALLSATLLFSSCQKTEENLPSLPPDAVQVRSAYENLDYLVPGDFDYDSREDGIFARYKFDTYVTEVDQMLTILPNYRGLNNTQYRTSTEYHFRSQEPSNIELYGNERGVFCNGEQVIAEACVGFIQYNDNENFLILTATETESRIYCASVFDDVFSVYDQVITLDSPISFFYCDWILNGDAPNPIYLITEDHMTLLYAGDFLDSGKQTPPAISVKTLEVPEWWTSIRPTSAVITDDGILYIGEYCGVIALTPEEEFIYYPIDYFDAF